MLKKAEILALNPNLISYRAMLHEDKGDKSQIAFDCYAEDDGHAADQAQNAYPNGEVLTIAPFSGNEPTTAEGVATASGYLPADGRGIPPKESIMTENKTAGAIYFGQEAIDRFGTCLGSYLQDDATGKAYIVYRGDFTELRMAGMTLARTEEMAKALQNEKRIGELDQYEMLVVDSGNSSGDSWVATFYPKQRAMTFVDQLARRGIRYCMSCGGSEDAGFRDGQCSACAGHSEVNAMRQQVTRSPG